MTLGVLGFLNPWALMALGALPLLYWLLRTVPPQPRTVSFPPTRMLKDLENRKQTPARTPWWLMLIRLLAAALVIGALAEPVLNPKRGGSIASDGPLVVVIDNDWAAAGHWTLRQSTAVALIAEAEAQQRAVVVAATANAAKLASLKLESPAAARETLAAMKPQPFAPKRGELLPVLEKALGDKRPGKIVWLADGLDHHSDAQAFMDGLAKLAGGASALTVISGVVGEEALGLSHRLGPGGKLIAEIKRAEGDARGGMIQAWSSRGQQLGQVPFRMGAGETKTDVTFDIPLELRNQVARMDIAGAQSAGGVSLLDSRSRWHRAGLIASTSREQAQPLLSPLYYIDKALAPFAELSTPKDADVVSAFDAVLAQNTSAIMLADVGMLTGQTLERARDWVKRGGVLVRFAGPRLEKAGDELLPVPLRLGGRTLGGALSWSTPEPLAPFEADSLFAGLTPPADVLISRQVLADPARLGPDVKVWARLRDGTPLVTAAKRGEGWLVLFHVTANSDWSNLPLSGLFVEMMRRIVALGAGGGVSGRAAGLVAKDATAPAGSDANPAASDSANSEVLAPVETLNGFGELKSPPVTAQAIRASGMADHVPSSDHPPGLYGPPAATRALNLIGAKTILSPLPPLPSGAVRAAYSAEQARPLKPELLTLALTLLFADIAAVMLLQLGRGGGGIGRASVARAAQAVVLVAASAMVLTPMLPVGIARAQSRSQSPKPAPAQLQSQAQSPGGAARKPEDEFARASALKTQIAYVMTGDETTDRTSKQGLLGLNSVLVARTAVEPGEPRGIDISRDELAFFPVLYWPVLPGAQALPDKTLAKMDAYMKGGGMIVFDTRDYAQARPGSYGQDGAGGQALQRLIGALDLPRLEPVPEGHVLTKSFYLLRNFPGRWDGGQMWVEAAGDADKSDSRRARHADGVSSILITSNDLAAAWATDQNNRPLYAVVPGGEMQREMSYRTGVNIVMYALTGNYKADQVHVPALLERLGQ